MRALLDTHTFLWFITADPKLSRSAQQILSAGSNELYLSVAGLWEIAIKVGIGRLPLPQPLDPFLPEQLRINRVELLTIAPRHVLAVAHLPLHHRDPFDRLIIAQAMQEGLPIVSADVTFDHYGVPRLW
jgi:PIN domain nuclease of toxin-antitoxin system